MQTIPPAGARVMRWCERRFLAGRHVLRRLYQRIAGSSLAPVLHVPAVERARQSVNVRSISPDDVVELVGLLAGAGVSSWLVGGWGCDALLGHQTRPHHDLDLVVSLHDEAPAREVLEQAGFYLERAFRGARWMPLQLEMKDKRRSIGLHPVDLDAWCAERGWQSLREMAETLGVAEIGDLLVTGTVGDRTVPCVSAVAQLVLHYGYPLRDPGRRDLEALGRRFGLPLPLPAVADPDASFQPLREPT
jgi:lincosamide nucleotidyltransferase A/C/D/E